MTTSRCRWEMRLEEVGNETSIFSVAYTSPLVSVRTGTSNKRYWLPRTRGQEGNASRLYKVGTIKGVALEFDCNASRMN
jgi:hypothetical protein